MMLMMSIAFAKYEGLGNDFILVDSRGFNEPIVTPDQAALLCDRNFGIGADGVIFVLDANEGKDCAMRIYNSDASEPEMCGNGIRCFARYLKTLGFDGDTFEVETRAGTMVPRIRDDGLVTVDMGAPVLESDDWLLEGYDAPLLDYKFTCVSMGNPHAVAFVDDLDKVDLAREGPLYEHNEVFPNRVNTEFVQVIDRNTLKMKVWERGAGATLACGTGACAVAVAASLTGRAERDCTVQLPGGDLQILWDEHNDKCYMTGPANFVFAGDAQLPPIGRRP